MLWMSFHEQQFPGKWFSKILQKSPKKKVSLHISIMFIIIIFIQVMRRAHSQSPRLPTKNQHHEEAQLSHLLLLPDQASSQLPARPPSYPAAAPSHAQRERAELQLRQLGSNANVPRIRVSCEPDLAQISQLFPGQGQDNRGRSPGRSGAWESEVERQMPKTSHDWSWADHAIFTPLAAGNKLLALSPNSSLMSLGFWMNSLGKVSFPSLLPNSIKVGFGGILVTASSFVFSLQLRPLQNLSNSLNCFTPPEGQRLVKVVDLVVLSHEKAIEINCLT